MRGAPRQQNRPRAGVPLADAGRLDLLAGGARELDSERLESRKDHVLVAEVSNAELEGDARDHRPGFERLSPRSPVGLCNSHEFRVRYGHWLGLLDANGVTE